MAKTRSTPRPTQATTRPPPREGRKTMEVEATWLDYDESEGPKAAGGKGIGPKSLRDRSRTKIIPPPLPALSPGPERRATMEVEVDWLEPSSLRDPHRS